MPNLHAEKIAFFARRRPEGKSRKPAPVLGLHGVDKSRGFLTASQLCTLSGRAAGVTRAFANAARSPRQLADCMDKKKRLPVADRTRANDVNGPACQGRRFTHKVIHIAGGQFRHFMTNE
ncbi:MAG: hypothetical protein ABI440_08375 [Casimicrobiaceae bacterium]